MSVPDLIAAVGERLTPTERRIATAVLAEPTLIAFGTVSDLASRVGTSRPSIVRFATKLGFEGYTHLQEEVRDGMSQQLSRPSQRIRHQDGSLAPSRAALEEAIGSVFDALDEDRLAPLAAPIVRARRVWILTGETSRAGALVLHSGLSMIRSDVHLVGVHSGSSELGGAARGDVAVVFDFARYRRHSITAARTLAGLGIDIVAMTDGPLSPLASLTETWCELKVPGIGPFDSSVPAVAFAELTVAHVAAQLRDEDRAHIDRTESFWEATETFLP